MSRKSGETWGTPTRLFTFGIGHLLELLKAEWFDSPLPLRSLVIKDLARLRLEIFE
jgi:hypothetical protein